MTSGKIKAITIELDEIPTEDQAPPFTGGLPLTLVLDEPGDVDAAQTAFLEGLLARNRDSAGMSTSFSFRFRYDLDGAAHYHGPDFVLDVLLGSCLLRRATKEDHDGFQNGRRDQRDYRTVLAQNRVLYENDPRDYRVPLNSAWVDLTAAELKVALDMFKVAEVMMT